jgi:transposase
MAARKKPVDLGACDRGKLERWARGRSTPQGVVVRSRIVLCSSRGLSTRAIAKELGISRTTVDLWRGRFAEGGCAALAHDRPGRGRKRRSDPA